MQQSSTSTAHNSQSPPQENMSQPTPSSEIPPSPSPPLCSEPESLGDDQVESGENLSIEALAGDKTTKLGEMEPKRGYLTLNPSLQRAGTSVETPDQLRLSYRET